MLSNSSRDFPWLWRVFLALALAYVVAISVFAAEIAQEFNDVQTTFWAILILLISFHVLSVAITGVVTENPFDLWLFVALSTLLSAFVIVQSMDMAKDLHVRRMAVVATMQFLFWGLGLVVQRKFGWWVFLRAGANSSAHLGYRSYQLWMTLLKLDLVLSLCSGIVTYFSAAFPWVYVLDSVLMLLNLVWAVVGYMGVKTESSRLTQAFLVLSVVIPLRILSSIALDVVMVSQGGPSDERNTLMVQVDIVRGLAILLRMALIGATLRLRSQYGSSISVVRRDAAQSEYAAIDDTRTFFANRAPRNADSVSGGLAVASHFTVEARSASRAGAERKEVQLYGSPTGW